MPGEGRIFVVGIAVSLVAFLAVHYPVKTRNSLAFLALTCTE